jgi:hypothetical protein
VLARDFGIREREVHLRCAADEDHRTIELARGAAIDTIDDCDLDRYVVVGGGKGDAEDRALASHRWHLTTRAESSRIAESGTANGRRSTGSPEWDMHRRPVFQVFVTTWRAIQLSIA